MGGFMKAMGGGSYEGGDASAGGGNEQTSGLHITTGGSDTGDGKSNRLVMIAALAAAGFVLYKVVS